MSAYLLLEEMFMELTGKKPPQTGDFWSAVSGVPALAGYNVIFSADRVVDALPDRAFPYILIERGGISTTDRKYAKSAEIFFDIGIKGNKPGTMTEIDRVANAFAAWLDTTVFQNSIKVYPQSISFAVGEKGTQWASTRYATITAQALVSETW